jgi:hypothetical protein
VTVVVSPDTNSILQGDSLTLVALVYDAQDLLLNREHPTWSSSDPTVATVRDSGQIATLAAGNATITATVNGLTGNGLIRVLTTDSTIQLARDVQPALTITCGLASCHRPPNAKKGLDLSTDSASYQGLIASGTALVTPGDTTVGLLLRRLRGDTAQMPPDSALAKREAAYYHLIALWIEQGAPKN